MKITRTLKVEGFTNLEKLRLASHAYSIITLVLDLPWVTALVCEIGNSISRAASPAPSRHLAKAGSWHLGSGWP